MGEKEIGEKTMTLYSLFEYFRILIGLWSIYAFVVCVIIEKQEKKEN